MIRAQSFRGPNPITHFDKFKAVGIAEAVAG